MKKQPLDFEATVAIISGIKDPEDKLLMSLCLYAGLRVGEAINVRVEDLYGEHMKVRKTKVKGSADKYRYVKICRPLQDIIFTALPCIERDDRLFYGRNHGTPLTDDGANLRVKKYFGEGETVHSLRKTAALRLYVHSEYDITVPMQFLDHRDTASTVKYLGLTQKKVDKAVEDAFSL